MASVVKRKRLATAPTFQSTLKYRDGTVQDLNGASVKFCMRVKGAAVHTVYAAASIVGTPSDGNVEYAPLSTDVQNVGTYEQEWEVTLSGGKIAFFPMGEYNTIIIVDDVKTD